MPLAGFYCTATSKRVSFEEAPAHFEKHSQIPSEVIHAIIKNEAGRDGLHARVSPSKLCPATTCRREVVIKRFVDYWLDPMVVWEATEGTIWHAAFKEAGHVEGDGWEREKRIPTGGPITQGEGPLTIDPNDGEPVYEVFPGIFMAGTVDKYHLEQGVLEDFKTARYPKTYGKKPPSEDFTEAHGKYVQESVNGEWAIQLNTYREMVRLKTGVDLKELWVRRIYRGSRDRALTFRRFRVPIVPKERLWEVIGPFVSSLVGYLGQALAAKKSGGEEAVLKVVKTVPMDGEIKKMFNNSKCRSYCPVADICLGLEGRTLF